MSGSNREFENKMKRLEEIIAALESPDIPLEEGMALYKEGTQCARFCRDALEKARHDLEMWDNDMSVPLDLSTLEETVPF